MPEVTGQTPQSHAQGAEDLTIPPAHGRAGRGTASILPHLNRQQQINDKPVPAEGAGDDVPLPHRSKSE